MSADGQDIGKQKLSRRKLLIKGSVGGGMVWAAPAISGLARASAQATCAAMNFPFDSNVPGRYTVIFPTGTTSINVQAWGAGGGGSNAGRGAGGGGGGYVGAPVNVTPCVEYEVRVGKGGAPGNPGRQGDPSHLRRNTTFFVFANGGLGADRDKGGLGRAGSANGASGPATIFTGGNGSDRHRPRPSTGGGGGGAGSAGNGMNAPGRQGGLGGPPDGGKGGDGAPETGGPDFPGMDGFVPGGGGGGKRGNANSGSGGNGRVILTP